MVYTLVLSPDFQLKEYPAGACKLKLSYLDLSNNSLTGLHPGLGTTRKQHLPLLHPLLVNEFTYDVDTIKIAISIMLLVL